MTIVVERSAVQRVTRTGERPGVNRTVKHAQSSLRPTPPGFVNRSRREPVPSNQPERLKHISLGQVSPPRRMNAAPGLRSILTENPERVRHIEPSIALSGNASFALPFQGIWFSLNPEPRAMPWADMPWPFRPTDD